MLSFPPSSLLPSGLSFLGEATVSEYESLLRSLSYNNTAAEPTPGNRRINITLFDGLHRDITAVIVIVVLVSDNPIMIDAAERQLTFIEGDVALDIGQQSGIILTDVDREPMVTSMEIKLENALEADREFLVIDLSTILGEDTGIVTGVEIVVNATRSLEAYQVSR